MSKLPLVSIFVALALILDVCYAGLTPPSDYDSDFSGRPNSRRMLDNAPVTKKELSEVACSDMGDNCHGCLQMRSCVYVIYNTSVTKCLEQMANLADLKKVDPSMAIQTIVMTESQCPSEAEPRQAMTTLEPDNTTPTTSSSTSSTTTSTSPTMTTSEANTTSSTTATPTTTASSTTTSTSTTSATSQSSTTSSASTPSSTTSSRPATTSEDPDARQGNKFDGWSFFGGILLTVGISAIGFVSYKYYKVRSGGGSGTNYNRF